jgi:hypothetical protein
VPPSLIKSHSLNGAEFCPTESQSHRDVKWTSVVLAHHLIS